MGVVATLATSGRAQVTYLDGDLRGDLEEQLRELAEAGARFDVVLVIGHSNADGIRLASDRFASWGEFAAYVVPFEPRQLILVACQAGRWSAGRALFSALPLLTHLYACPVNASKDLAAYLVTVALMALDGPLPGKVVLFLQGLAGLTAGGQFRRWTRADMNDPDGQLLDVVSVLANSTIRDIPSILKGLLGGG